MGTGIRAGAGGGGGETAHRGKDDRIDSAERSRRRARLEGARVTEWSTPGSAAAACYAPADALLTRVWLVATPLPPPGASPSLSHSDFALTALVLSKSPSPPSVPQP